MALNTVLEKDLHPATAFGFGSRLFSELGEPPTCRQAIKSRTDCGRE